MFWMRDAGRALPVVRAVTTPTPKHSMPTLIFDKEFLCLTY